MMTTWSVLLAGCALAIMGARPAMADDLRPQDVPAACRAFFDPGGTLHYTGAKQKVELCLQVVADLKADAPQPLFEKLRDHFSDCSVGRGGFILNSHKEIFHISPPQQTTLHELAAIAEYEMACRIDNTEHINAGFDRIRDQDPAEEIGDVVQHFEPDLEKQRAIDAQAEAVAAQRQRQQIAHEAERHALAESGYIQSNVRDIETDGASDIGKKVVISGWLTVFDQQAAELTAGHDDFNGLIVDLRDASHEVRYDIFHRCASSNGRCMIKIKATVVENADGSGVHLRLE